MHSTHCVIQINFQHELQVLTQRDSAAQTLAQVGKVSPMVAAVINRQKNDILCYAFDPKFNQILAPIEQNPYHIGPALLELAQRNKAVLDLQIKLNVRQPSIAFANFAYNFIDIPTHNEQLNALASLALDTNRELYTAVYGRISHLPRIFTYDPALKTYAEQLALPQTLSNPSI